MKIINKYKRLITIIIVLSIILSTTVQVKASTAFDYDKSYETYNINGQNFEIIFNGYGNIRTATILENNGQNITLLEINDVTGVVTCNGRQIRTDVISTTSLGTFRTSNWSSPTTSIVSLSFAGYTIGALVGYLQLKYNIMPEKAAYIAGLIIGAGGFLYIKGTSQYNYVDFAPKIGYRLTESFHLRSDASDPALHTRTLSGVR